MVKSVKIVIGANYGDEGKGLASRYFSLKADKENKRCLTILFNGGSQRGHTADLKNGLRHVFHHFGSGSFDNSDTFFDSDFIVNPMIFAEEIEELGDKVPRCFISEQCRVTLPYDMMINQIIEISRGTQRHGSCGYGIWETQKRYEESTLSLRYGMLSQLTDHDLMSYLIKVSEEYLPVRLRYYGITEIPSDYKDLVCSEGIMQHFIDDFRKMSELTQTADLIQLSEKYDYFVFEGGQGLALDENAVDEYPNVTASSTGAFTPVIRSLEFLNTFDIEVCYVSRSYFTRHGAGKLPFECPKESISPHIIDKTNVYNEFQGNIRYADFDVQTLLRRTITDHEKCRKECNNIKKSLFLTHLNYVETPVAEFCDHFDTVYLSYSKFAEDVQLLIN